MSKCESCVAYEHKIFLDGYDTFLSDLKLCKQGRKVSEDGCELYQFNGIGNVP